MFRNWSFAAGICALFITPMVVRADPIVVFAAASLRGALDEAVAQYPGEVVISYAGSGVIARQAALGAPVDVVILANTIWMDWLIAQGTVTADQRHDFLSNRLVVIAPSGADLMSVTPATLLENLAGGRLAIGQVAAVPAGIYAKEWMQNAGIWDDLSPHLAEVDNVRAALRLVSLAETPMGIVYATDARMGDVKVIHTVDQKLHSEILYSIAVIHRKEREQLTDLTHYLVNQGLAAFLRRGFLEPVDK